MADEEGQLQEPKPIDEKLQKLVDKALYAGGSPIAQTIRNFLNGTWLGEPLHVILTDIPIGAWTRRSGIRWAGPDAASTRASPKPRIHRSRLGCWERRRRRRPACRLVGCRSAGAPRWDVSWPAECKRHRVFRQLARFSHGRECAPGDASTPRWVFRDGDRGQAWRQVGLQVSRGSRPHRWPDVSRGLRRGDAGDGTAE